MTINLPTNLVSTNYLISPLTFFSIFVDFTTKHLHSGDIHLIASVHSQTQLLAVVTPPLPPPSRGGR